MGASMWAGGWGGHFPEGPLSSPAASEGQQLANDYAAFVNKGPSSPQWEPQLAGEATRDMAESSSNPTEHAADKHPISSNGGPSSAPSGPPVSERIEGEICLWDPATVTIAMLGLTMFLPEDDEAETLTQKPIRVSLTTSD
eukprot:1195574-Prorocentrum_minimum.AAC.9